MENIRNLRMTRQRKTILETLKQFQSHPSADEVYQRVRNKLPKISLGTVYRNLEVLSDRGFIKKLETGGAQRRYDANCSDHYHIRCVSCGRVDDIMMAERSLGFDTELNASTDYEILEYRIEFVGICPDCRGKNHGDSLKKEEKGEKEWD